MDFLTWRDESGEIMTKATKARLAERLHALEKFVWACVSCNVEKSHVSMAARLMKLPHVIGNTDMEGFFKGDLARQIERYRLARQKRDNMLAVLTKMPRKKSSSMRALGCVL